MTMNKPLRKYTRHHVEREHHSAENGLMGWDEIGRRLGMTRQRAQQICREALYKLRRNPLARELYEQSEWLIAEPLVGVTDSESGSRELNRTVRSRHLVGSSR